MAELIERSNVPIEFEKTPAKIGSKETSNDSNVTILAQPRNLKTLTKLTSQRLYGFDIWGHACTMVTAGDFKFWHRVGACGSAFTRLTSLRVGTRGRPLQEHRRPHACCNTGPSRREPHTPGQTLSVALYLLFLCTCLRCRFLSIPGSKLPWKLLRSCLSLCTCLSWARPPPAPPTSPPARDGA